MAEASAKTPVVAEAHEVDTFRKLELSTRTSNTIEGSGGDKPAQARKEMENG